MVRSETWTCCFMYLLLSKPIMFLVWELLDFCILLAISDKNKPLIQEWLLRFIPWLWMLKEWRIYFWSSALMHIQTILRSWFLHCSYLDCVRWLESAWIFVPQVTALCILFSSICQKLARSVFWQGIVVYVAGQKDLKSMHRNDVFWLSVLVHGCCK